MNTSSIKIFKFGGASIKDAPSIRNVASILEKYKGEKIVIVISALGKTTNALEAVTNAYFNNKGNAAMLLENLRQSHYLILKELFVDTTHPVFDVVNNAFVEIDWILEDEPEEKYDYIYDQVVSIGEMVASKLVAAYLKHLNIPVQWADARDFIHTDNTFREGKVDWILTEKSIHEKIPALLKGHFVLTQGFIGGTSENYTTTLGREGSDYTAAILGYALNAESVTIWKDVPGVLNADPRYFPDAKKIDLLSYHEAIEMTYYGASVIHPKTIKPLQNKKIPLLVRPFLNAMEAGTLISDDEKDQEASKHAVQVLKTNQILISVSATDFSFIAEENLSLIFSVLSRHRVKVNMLQNAAISFSICADHDEKIPPVIAELGTCFGVRTNEGLELLTIRHYTQQLIDDFSRGKEVLLEQKTRQTAQLVLRTIKPQSL